MSYRESGRVTATQVTRGERMALRNAAGARKQSDGGMASVYIREGLLRSGYGPDPDGRWVHCGGETEARMALLLEEQRLGGGGE